MNKNIFNLLVSVLLCQQFTTISARPHYQAGDYIEPLKYLKRYGIFKGKLPAHLNEEEAHQLIKEPLRKFKKNYGLHNIEGDLDDEARQMMEKPRCSQPDDFDVDIDEKRMQGRDFIRRFKRHTFLNGGKFIWKDKRTPYPIKIGFKNYWQGNANSKLSRKQQEDAAMTCAKKWAEKADLEFRLARPGETANIEIEFVYIDGPYGSVGKGLSPVPFRDPPTSYLELDSSENWMIGPEGKGVNLIAGICHEMGHTLSLGHSEIKEAIMFPTITDANEDAVLHKDDYDGIIKLYGPRTYKPKSYEPYEINTTKAPVKRIRTTIAPYIRKVVTTKAPIKKIPTTREPIREVVTTKPPIAYPTIIRTRTTQKPKVRRQKPVRRKPRHKPIRHKPVRRRPATPEPSRRTVKTQKRRRENPGQRPKRRRKHRFSKCTRYRARRGLCRPRKNRKNRPKVRRARWRRWH